MSDQITKLVADLKEQEVLNLVGQKLDQDADPGEILNACQQGMVQVGEKFEQGTYFISDLMMAGEIFKQISNMLAPKLKTDVRVAVGKVVVGTVRGDIHDIGKDLVIAMLKSYNFEIMDLGVDVPPERFVEAVRETGATIVALSALLTVAFEALKETVDGFVEAGLRDQVKVMIGGGPINETVRAYSGADAWGSDPQAAVRLAKGWLQ